MRTKWFVLLIATIAAFTLWGCGSNGGSGGDSTSGPPSYGEDADGNEYVSAGECLNCHEDFSWSGSVVSKYLAGKHVIHSDHINAGSDPSCLECHDPIGDGPTVEPFIDPADVPAEGLAAVGCENCHGGGGNHFGVGPMPIPNPDYTACGQCHSTLPDSHAQYHPEGNNILEKYESSRHKTASIRNEAVCSKCHTDEGGRKYKDVQTRESLYAHVLPIEGEANPVQCRTCHDPHNPNKLLLDEIEDHGHVVASAEYATCTTCHMSDVDSPADVEGGIIYHEDRYYRIITDTHYDDPATTDLIEGYVVIHEGEGSERSCRVCHDMHSAEEIRADRNTNTVNDQWAKSGHAGHISEVKAEVAQEFKDNGMDRTVDQSVAIKAAYVDGDESAWPHYDWDAGNRQSCQRCHTTTGLVNYTDDPENYNSELNDFSHLEGWERDADTGDVTSSGQNELLYCWGCHSDNNGGLNNPGAILEDYGDCAIVQYGDIDESNVCLSCHIGREIGENVQNSDSDFNDRSFINSHYLAAGASLFGVSGFEYEGENYAPVSYYKHDSIGTPYINSDGVDDNMGPCAGCHLTSEQGHRFLPYEINEAGDDFEYITDVCSDCHGDGVTVDFIKEEEHGYAASLEALNVALGKIGIFFAPNYPYFFNDLDDTSRNNGVKDWIKEDAYPGGLDVQQAGKNTMGAAFNFNLAAHESGGFAHNRIYYKRLYWDAIDWADDYIMNGSTAATITEYKADGDMSDVAADTALEYLGDTRPGSSNDRDPIPGLDPTFPPCNE